MSVCRTPAFCLVAGICRCPSPDGRDAKKRREPAAQSRRTIITTFGMQVIDDSADYDENTEEN